MSVSLAAGVEFPDCKDRGEAMMSAVRGLVVLFLLLVATLDAPGARGGTTKELERQVFQAVLAEESDATKLATEVRGGMSFRKASKQFGLKSNDVEIGVTTERKMEDMVPLAVARALFSSKTGTVIGPIRTDLGWHVLQSFEVEEIDGPWLPISTGATGVTTELNVETVRVNGGERRVWVRYTDRTNRRKTAQTVAYVVLDCANDRIATTSGARYENGKYVGDLPDVPEVLIPDRLKPVIPDTRGAEIHRIVCKSKWTR
jgi:hypothetical protein